MPLSEMKPPSTTRSHPPLSSRRALFLSVSFCVCWFVLMATKALERLELPVAFYYAVEFLVPILVSFAVLHKSSLFGENPKWIRVVRLLLCSIGLLLIAGLFLVLLFTLLVLVFGDRN